MKREILYDYIRRMEHLDRCVDEWFLSQPTGRKAMRDPKTSIAILEGRGLARDVVQALIREETEMSALRILARADFDGEWVQ